VRRRLPVLTAVLLTSLFAAPLASAAPPSPQAATSLVSTLWGSRPTPETSAVLTTYVNGSPRFTRFTPRSQTELAELSSLVDNDASRIGWEQQSRRVVTASTTPNDPLWSLLWGVPAVNGPGVWPRTKGSGAVVAVIDSGVNEVADLTGQLLPGRTYLSGVVTAGAPDDNGHGTHVAGTIAAISDNDEGVVGVAPEVKILPVKVLDAEGFGSSSDIAAAVVWAADQGADVINLSLGGNYAPHYETAVSYAISKGSLVIAAAGNSGNKDNAVSYPAALPDVVAVGALNQNLTPASYSTRGNYVDLAAPGSGIVSTGFEGGYESSSGTSMATPHVAGVAALLRAAHPTSTVTQLRQAIESSLTDVHTPGFDTATGNGLVDAEGALEALDTTINGPTPTTSTPPSTTSPPPPTSTTVPPSTTTPPTTTPPTTTPPTTQPPTTQPPTPWPAPAPARVDAEVVRADVSVTATAVPGAVGYQFLRNDELVHSSPSPLFRDADRARRKGRYVYQVRAIGPGGELGSTRSVVIRVAPPRRPVVSRTSVGQKTRGGRVVTFSMTRYPSGTRVALYRSGELLTETSAGARTRVTLPPGRHRVVLHAWDRNGFSKPSKSITIRVPR
jgi:serine protease